MGAESQMREPGWPKWTHGQALVFVECRMCICSEFCEFSEQSWACSKFRGWGKVHHPSNKFLFSWWNLKNIDWALLGVSDTAYLPRKWRWMNETWFSISRTLKSSEVMSRGPSWWWAWMEVQSVWKVEQLEFGNLS